MTNTLTDFTSFVYGSLVCSLLDITDDVAVVNAKLFEIGKRIGLRIAHEFGKDLQMEQTQTFKSVIKNVIKKQWSNIVSSKTCRDVKYDEEQLSAELEFDSSVFTRDVNVPNKYSQLEYISILPGLIKGIFEAFHFEVETEIISSSLNSESKISKIFVKCIREIPEEIPKED